MKNTIALCFLFLSTFVSGQADNIDEGFFGLAVNTDKSKIEQKLTMVDTSDLWLPVKNTMFVSNTATVVVDNSLTYFGLNVARIEVQFQDYYDDEKQGHDIYQFTVFLERPSEDRYYEFYEQVFDTYGPSLTYSIDMENGTESPNWFTDITLMTVSSFNNYVEHNGKKYVMVTYMQGYGG